MESYDEENGVIPFHQYYSNDFGLIDFLDEANVDQFVDLIRGETADHVQNQPIFNYYDHHDYQYCHDDLSNVAAAADGSCNFLPTPPPQQGLFEFDAAAHVDAGDGLVNACLDQAEEEDELLMDEDESSGSGAAGAGTPRGKNSGGNKADRSRTLVSERRRRGRMKEKLYALRSLVPNITKMDKASIVGDAVLYLQDLQAKANRMRAEIAGLESSMTRGDKHPYKSSQNGKKSNQACFYPTTKMILKMDVSEVEERGFYVRIVSNRANGVAPLLYRALESLTSFNVRNSNLAASADQRYVFTFTLHKMEGEMDVSLQSVKVWLASVFLNQGFEFQTSVAVSFPTLESIMFYSQVFK